MTIDKQDAAEGRESDDDEFPESEPDEHGGPVVHENELLSSVSQSGLAGFPTLKFAHALTGAMQPKFNARTFTFNGLTQAFGAGMLAGFHEQAEERSRILFAPIRATLEGASLSRHFEGMLRMALPPNLRAVGEQIDVSQVMDFLREEGIPLYLVPRASVGLRLLRAPTRQARRQVLNDRFHAIVEDCSTLLERCTDPLVKTEVHFVEDGLGALRGGNYASAQAMFTLTLDSLIQGLYPARQERQNITVRRQGALSADALKDKALREAYVWLPIHNAHEEFWADKGHKVPNHYSRHASVHAVSRKQFNKRNCVQSLMLITSLIGYVDTMAKQARKRG
jgi:hypothetical protein